MRICSSVIADLTCDFCDSNRCNVAEFTTRGSDIFYICLPCVEKIASIFARSLIKNQTLDNLSNIADNIPPITIKETPNLTPPEYKDKDNDPVNHPAHYTAHPSGIECIQITRHMTFNLGNAFKHIWRAGLKSPDKKKDLKKAIWYLNDEINNL